MALAPISMKFSAILLALILATPILAIGLSVLSPDWHVWRHLIDTLLAEYVTNSLVLAIGVGSLATAIGTVLAWLMVHYEFNGKTTLSWLIVLPLAMPAYIIAYTYTGLLDFAGPVQSYIRQTLQLASNTQVLPEIRSLPGAIILMALVLYPYVYLLARNAFASQSSHLQEVSYLLGKSKRQHFWRVAIPLARPALLTGAALVMMEALADFGTVQFFGVSTFTTGIYRTWFGMGELAGAAQLSALLCVFVLLCLSLEKSNRQDAKVYVANKGPMRKPLRLRASKALLVLLICALPPVIGFIVPLAQLLYWVVNYDIRQNLDGFMLLSLNSFGVALLAALSITLLALYFSYVQRLTRSRLTRYSVQLVTLGYALPGVVVAVGVLGPFSFVDLYLNDLTNALGLESFGLLFSGSLFTLVFAYGVRFLNVAISNTDTGLARVSVHMDEVAQSLGSGATRRFITIHLPLLTSSLLAALLLVFVDVLKELPATLILRPFNFNTLAVKTFELASDERLIDAALPALTIVAVGILPVIIVTRLLHDRSH